NRTVEILSNLNEKKPYIRKIASGANELKAEISEILSKLNAKSPDIRKLASGAKELNAGTGEILSNLNEKAPDIRKLASGANELNARKKFEERRVRNNIVSYDIYIIMIILHIIYIT